MINIYEVSVLDLLPPNLKEDTDMIAAAKAVDNDFVLVVNEVKQCIFLPKIDEIKDGNLIDLLAWQMHVDFYDYLLPLSKKIELVKNSKRWHIIKGTPQAVEELTETIFGGDSQVIEWFQYDGEPYTFRVSASIESLKDGLKTFYKMLDTVKNTRSHLDSVIGVISDELKLETKYKEYPYPYWMCGTFLCGTKPDVNTLGTKVTTELKANTNNKNTKQKYPIAGTFESGGDTI